MGVATYITAVLFLCICIEGGVAKDLHYYYCCVHAYVWD